MKYKKIALLSILVGLLLLGACATMYGGGTQTVVMNVPECME